MKQVSTDIKVNQFYYEAAKSFCNHCHVIAGGTLGGTKGILERFNNKFDTGYALIEFGDYQLPDLVVISNESKEMDKLFVRLVKQLLPLGVCVKVYKEV